MTRRTPTEPGPPRDEFAAALAAYRCAFGAEHLPTLFLPSSCMEVGARVLRAAVARGRPLRDWTLMRVCGIRRPPEGVLL